MNHIEAAQQAVLKKYGPAYMEIAACAAVAARTATVEEYDEWVEQLRGGCGDLIREALRRMEAGDRASARGILKDLAKGMGR